MNKKIFLVPLFALLTQGCSQDDFIGEMFVFEKRTKEIDFPKDIENYGKAVALDIKTTVRNLAERGINYSEFVDSEDFSNRFFSDWYAANPKVTQTRSVDMQTPQRMSASEFAERYRMLTPIQIDFINKIIKECELSSSIENLLERLIVLKDDICLHVPEIEQDRLLYIISVLYYSVQTISEMEEEGIMLDTPYNNILSLSQIKTRSENGTIVVPDGCRSFLATVWAIAVGEPTPAGEIVASVITVYVAGVMMYEVITCKYSSMPKINCEAKYADCIENNSEWSKNNSGGWGSTMCNQCFIYCKAQNIWDCPRPI